VDAGLDVVRLEERPDWLECQRVFFERVVAADGEDAEPALRGLAEEGRTFLANLSRVRRILVVAEPGRGRA